MSDSKLSDLTAATTSAPADLVYTVQGGTSKKATREILQTYDAGTLTTDKKVLDLSATWNAAGVTFTGVKFNVTNTASAAGSRVFDFQIGGTTQLALTATGLGVGTASPLSPLTVYNPTANTVAVEIRGGGGSSQSFLNFTYGSATTSAAITGRLFSSLSEVSLQALSSQPIIFATGGGEKLRLDSSGNLGLGVTPATDWFAASKFLQLGTGAVIAGRNNDATVANLLTNCSITTAGLFKYISTNPVAGYEQRSGEHSWFTAASGSAGAIFSFTERLRITNGGLLTFGGQTSSFPALKRSSTTLQVRLADDSGDAPFSSGRATIDTLTVGRGGATAVANNTAVGLTALNNVNLTGDSNAAFGSTALRDTSTGASNSAFGHAALVQNTTGSNNSALGQAALFSVTTAGSNSAFGSQALRYFNTSNNVAVGYEAVRGSTTVANNTGISLVGVGYQALQANTSGSYNNAFGDSALLSNTTGGLNNAFGSAALAGNVSGSQNVAFGYLAMRFFNTSNNVAVGHEALKGGSNTVADNTGANNIAIGWKAGDAITTGSNNIVIGHDIDPDSATGSSQINIGARYFHDRIRLLERTSDPAKPTEGNMIVWMSDGTGLGDDGDVMIASTAGGVTNYAILFDHSAGTVWP